MRGAGVVRLAAAVRLATVGLLIVGSVSGCTGPASTPTVTNAPGATNPSVETSIPLATGTPIPTGACKRCRPVPPATVTPLPTGSLGPSPSPSASEAWTLVSGVCPA